MDLKNKKCLVAYFSRKGENYVSGSLENLEIGNTELIAQMIQKETEADLFEINAVNEYPKSYIKCTEAAKKELNAKERPQITGHMDNMNEYQVVFLGFPNWWGTCPMPVFTFMEEYDFSGKIVVPFCTHEGSGFGSSLTDIKNTCKGAIMGRGIEIHGTNAPKASEIVSNWLENI